MPFAGGYELHLYCNTEHTDLENYVLNKKNQFYGETFAEAAKSARRHGWTVNRITQNVRCPLCSGHSVFIHDGATLEMRKKARL